MSEEFPKVTKSISDLSPSRTSIFTRFRKGGARSLVLALGLLGIPIGASSTPSALAANPAFVPAITNRKERGRQNFILHLGSRLIDQASLLAHRSHRSHSSHRSHYSGSGGSGGYTVPAPRPAAPPKAEADDPLLIADAQTLTGKITEVEDEKQYFVLQDAAEIRHTLHFKGTTKVRILSPTDRTTTLDTLKAFTGSVPLKLGKTVLVHWKTVEQRKSALLITLFDSSN
jgi:hypothetical protein